MAGRNIFTVHLMASPDQRYIPSGSIAVAAFLPVQQHAMIFAALQLSGWGYIWPAALPVYYSSGAQQ